MSLTEPEIIGFGAHDHKRCRHTALTRAHAYCVEHGLQFTPLRRRVLEILLENHASLGAYDVMDRLALEGLGAQPPVAYRSLGFLVTHGFAHRIESRNAYVACAHPGAPHEAAFLICSECGAIAEAVVALKQGTLGRSARETGFAIAHTVREAEGRCPRCQAAPQR